MRLEEEVEFGPYNKPNTCNCMLDCDLQKTDEICSMS